MDNGFINVPDFLFGRYSIVYKRNMKIFKNAVKTIVYKVSVFSFGSGFAPKSYFCIRIVILMCLL